MEGPTDVQELIRLHTVVVIDGEHIVKGSGFHLEGDSEHSPDRWRQDPSQGEGLLILARRALVDGGVRVSVLLDLLIDGVDLLTASDALLGDLWMFDRQGAVRIGFVGHLGTVVVGVRVLNASVGHVLGYFGQGGDERVSCLCLVESTKLSELVSLTR